MGRYQLEKNGKPVKGNIDDTVIEFNQNKISNHITIPYIIPS